MPAAFFQYTMPRDVGVKLSFILSDGNKDPALVRPENIICASFRLFALLLAGTYFFTDADAKHGTTIKLASGFRTAPFSYLFVPVWLLMTTQVGCGIALTIIRQRLKGEDNYRIYLTMLIGACWLLPMFLCQWIVIPQFESSFIVRKIKTAFGFEFPLGTAKTDLSSPQGKLKKSW